jgi:hypothetical protein
MADEVKNSRNSDKEQFGAIMSIINADFAKGPTVVRVMSKVDSDRVFKRFLVYGPKVLAGIANISDIIRDRSMCIKTTRKSLKERTERLNMGREGKMFDALRASMEVGAKENGEAIKHITEERQQIRRQQEEAKRKREEEAKRREEQKRQQAKVTEPARKTEETKKQKGTAATTLPGGCGSSREPAQRAEY